jgi:hypothetical protein
MANSITRRTISGAKRKDQTMQYQNLTKAQLIEHIEMLETKLDELMREYNYLNEECYTADQVDNMISDATHEAVEEYIANQKRVFALNTPEELRGQFRLIQSGAA